jgi:hypothetical protein
MHPLTWNDLPSIHDVSELDDTDLTCLEDVGQVLARHNKTGRFGAALLHQHFTLGEGELLVEHCDPEHRTLVTAPESAHIVLDRKYIPTVWRFDGQQPQACSYCPKHGNQHAGYKEQH